MTATIEVARDEIAQLFLDAWNAATLSSGLRVLFDDRPENVPTAASTDGNPPAWARLTIRHTSGSQATLAGADGRSRWRRNGVVTVQIFAPFGTGLSISDKLAMIALAAFEGQATASGVWFRNARLQEIGSDGPWFQVNVSAEFEYDEVR